MRLDKFFSNRLKIRPLYIFTLSNVPFPRYPGFPRLFSPDFDRVSRIDVLLLGFLIDNMPATKRKKSTARKVTASATPIMNLASLDELAAKTQSAKK